MRWPGSILGLAERGTREGKSPSCARSDLHHLGRGGYIKNKKDLALNYWKSSQSARAGNNILDGLHLIAEAGVTTDDEESDHTAF